MNQDYPVPPPELVQQWTALANEEEGCKVWSAIATQAAQWGADQELEACCQWVSQFNYDDYSYQERLQAARRHPKPLSLKEQALEQCNDYIDPDGIIRRALEQLPN